MKWFIKSLLVNVVVTNLHMIIYSQISQEYTHRPAQKYGSAHHFPVAIRFRTKTKDEK